MFRWIRRLAAFAAVPVLLAACAGTSAAQSVVVTPAPVYYYPAPVTSYYVAPRVSYYAPPVVSYYAPPAVTYYAAPAPAVAYYTPPAVSYYPAPVATVTTYRYGLLPRRQYTVTTYYGP